MDFLNGITLIANYIIIPGLTYGSQLALGALGITIIYSVLRFSNFAHGEFMSFGAMSSILLSWLFLTSTSNSYNSFTNSYSFYNFLLYY